MFSRNSRRLRMQWDFWNWLNLPIRCRTAAYDTTCALNECFKYDKTNWFAPEPTTACCSMQSARLYTSPLTPRGRIYNGIVTIDRRLEIDAKLTVLMLMPHCKSLHLSRQALKSRAFKELVLLVDSKLILLSGLCILTAVF